MCKFFVNTLNTGTLQNPICNGLETFRTINGTAFQNTDAGTPRRLNYALVELGTTGPLLDGGTGPGARLFNHSWNMDVIDYETNSILLDLTTRLLSQASFTFDGGQTRSGDSAPALHVVSAGNIGQFYPPPGPPPPPLTLWPNPNNVTAPGVAKNVITVGGTESYNQEFYNPNCGDSNGQYADNPHQIYGRSRIGFPNLRLKPDVVAPATASYGRASIEWNGCPGACNMNLDGTGQYAWSAGTSFAAPVVSGAAAMTAE